MRKKRNGLITVMLILIVLTACGQEKTEVKPTETLSPTPTATAVPLPATATPTPTVAVVPDNSLKERYATTNLYENDGYTLKGKTLDKTWKAYFTEAEYAGTDTPDTYITGGTNADTAAYTVNTVTEAYAANGITVSATGAYGEASDISERDWMLYKDIDFGEAGSNMFCTYLKASAEVAGAIAIVLDDPENEPVGYYQLPAEGTGGYCEINTKLLTTVKGKHDVYFLFAGEGYTMGYWYAPLESLQTLCGDYFVSGVALPKSVLLNDIYYDTIEANFASVTCENEMKPDAILDEDACRSNLPDTYLCPAIEFTDCKNAIDFALEKGIGIRLHTLVWHSQTPDWFFTEDYTAGGEPVSREVMLQRMENYIRQVLEYFNENYPGLIYAVDVVNEVYVGDDGDANGVRNSDNKWYDTVGADYAYYAFLYARKYASSDMKLFYNDYSCMWKKEQIVTNLKRMQDEGLIDGIGMQGHLSVGDNATKFLDTVKYFCENGYEVQITELDIGMDSKTDANISLQNALYKNIYSGLVMLCEEGYNFTGLTVWGLTDALTWRAGKYPLLFELDLTPKPAYYAILKWFK